MYAGVLLKVRVLLLAISKSVSMVTNAHVKLILFCK